MGGTCSQDSDSLYFLVDAADSGALDGLQAHEAVFTPVVAPLVLNSPGIGVRDSHCLRGRGTWGDGLRAAASAVVELISRASSLLPLASLSPSAFVGVGFLGRRGLILRDRATDLVADKNQTVVQSTRVARSLAIGDDTAGVVEPPVFGGDSY